MTERPKSPCRKDCEKRGEACFRNCDEYKIYEQAKFKFYEERKAYYDANIGETHAGRKNKNQFYRNFRGKRGVQG